MAPTRTVALLAVVAAVVLAGCGGSGSGPDPAVVDGSPAALPADAASEAGYEPAGATNRTVNTTVTLSISGDVQLDVTREVSATVPVRRYVRSTDGGPARLALAAVPPVRPVPDRPEVRNPVATTPGRLVRFLGGDPSLAGASFEHVANATVTLLGTETTLRVYATTADGRDYRVAVATVRHDGDAVSAVAAWPAGVDERGRLADLLSAVEH
ncbi:DUF6517 family protein [Halobaculum sp. EA56]|uniref:DUF6517 family protein n=1 Tax=Halobaculum sp. EA56 TaxID=3421648 RepID=UPI003EB961ED